jgi:hypothetical protein
MPFESKNPKLQNFLKDIRDYYLDREINKLAMLQLHLSQLAESDETRGIGSREGIYSGFIKSLITDTMLKYQADNADSPDEIRNNISLGLHVQTTFAMNQYVTHMDSALEKWMDDNQKTFICSQEDLYEAYEDFIETPEFEQIQKFFSTSENLTENEKMFFRLYSEQTERDPETHRHTSQISSDFQNHILVHQQLMLLEKLDNETFDFSENSDDRRAFEYGIAATLDRGAETVFTQNNGICYGTLAEHTQNVPKLNSFNPQDTRVILERGKMLSDAILVGKPIEEITYVTTEDGEKIVDKTIDNLIEKTNDSERLYTKTLINKENLEIFKKLNKTNLNKFLLGSEKISHMLGDVSLNAQRVKQEQKQIEEQSKYIDETMEEYNGHSFIYKFFHKTPDIRKQQKFITKHSEIERKMKDRLDNKQKECKNEMVKFNPAYMLAKQELESFKAEHSIGLGSYERISTDQVLKYESLTLNVLNAKFDAREKLGMNEIKREGMTNVDKLSREEMINANRLSINAKMLFLAEKPMEINKILNERQNTQQKNVIDNAIQAGQTAPASISSTTTIAQTQTIDSKADVNLQVSV